MSQTGNYKPFICDGFMSLIFKYLKTNLKTQPMNKKKRIEELEKKVDRLNDLFWRMFRVSRLHSVETTPDNILNDLMSDNFTYSRSITKNYQEICAIKDYLGVEIKNEPARTIIVKKKKK